MYSQTRRLTFPMTLSELKPKKCASKGFLVNGGHSHVVQKPLAARATRGLPGHLRSHLLCVGLACCKRPQLHYVC